MKNRIIIFILFSFVFLKGNANITCKGKSDFNLLSESVKKVLFVDTCIFIISPMNNDTMYSLNENIVWNAVPLAQDYQISIGLTPGGTELVNNENSLDTIYQYYSLFPPNDTIYISISTYIGATHYHVCDTHVVFTPDMTCETGFLFRNQNEINMFHLSNPGCTTVMGNLIIEEESSGEISNLDSLYNISIIEGSIRILNNEILQNISGLNNLQIVNGNVEIDNNNNLQSIQSISSLENIGGELYLGYCPDLTSLSGIQNIRYVGEGVYITNLDGLIDLQYLEIDTVINGLTLSSNGNLETINGLKINYIDSDLNIFGNNSLTQISQLDSVSFQNIDYIYISDNPQLSTCSSENLCEYLVYANYAYVSNNNSGCNSIAEIEMQCSLPDCTYLTLPVNGTTNVALDVNLNWAAVNDAVGYILKVGTSSGGGEILDSIDVGNFTTYNLSNNLPPNSTIYVSIWPYNVDNNNATNCIEETFVTVNEVTCSPPLFLNQAQIDNFPNAFPGCNTITSGVYIGSLLSGSSNITNLNGLSQITKINGQLDIINNSNLLNLNGLNNLTHVGGLYISQSSSLNTLSHLSNLSEIDGNLSLINLSNLQTLQGLEDISNLNGYLYLRNNNQLQNFNGLNLDTINGFIFIENHNQLNNINSIHSLKKINGYLYLNNNDALTTLDPLDQLDYQSITNLTIFNSANLSKCTSPTICNYLSNSSNTADIGSNKIGCNSRIQIISDCNNITPICTEILTPANNSSNVSISTNISWAPIQDAIGYKVFLGTASGFYDIIDNEDIGNSLSYDPFEDFPHTTKIYVKIVPYNYFGKAVGCIEYNFTTQSLSLSNNTWVSQTSGSTAQLWCVHFVNKNLGFATGNGTILKTINGGTNWSGTSAPQLNLDMHFSDQNNGWVVGNTGKIFKTNDGGNNWTSSNSGLVSNAVHFIDQSTGFGGGSSYFKKTYDGGQSWIVSNPNSVAETHNDIYFLPENSQYGWSIGNFGKVRITDDGGQTWTTSTAGSGILYEVQFVNSKIGWIVGSNGSIFKSMDGGKTWSQQISGTTNTLYSCYFLNKYIGYVVGAGGKILKTVNGGQTWVTQTSPVTTSLNHVHFYDQNNGWIVGDNGRVLKYNISNPAPECTKLSFPQNEDDNVIVSSDISWDVSFTATGYKVSIGTKPDGTDILNNQVLTTNTFNPTLNLPANTKIYTKIIPGNSGGLAINCPVETFTTANCSNLCCTTLSSPRPDYSDISIATNLSWYASPGATGYLLDVGTSYGGTELINNLNVGNVTTYNPLTDFPPSTTIYVTIKPYNSSGTQAGCGSQKFHTVSHKCGAGNIYLTNQSMIDQFSINYPGCTEIDGSLTIYGNDIINLNGLQQIERINEQLDILSTSNTITPLTNLNGLSNLEFIGERLYLNGLNSLTSLTGLSNLKEIGSSIGGFYGLDIRGNSNINSFNGLNKLKKIGGDIFLSNSSFTNFQGLDSLKYVGRIKIDSTALIQNFDNLQALEEIGYLEVINNVVVNDFDGFSQIRKAGNIYIDSTEIIELIGFNNLKSINHLRIKRNNELLNINGFNALIKANDIDIVQNSTLESIYGFDQLTNVNDFNIFNNIMLNELHGFPNLSEVTNEFSISSNWTLDTISAFQNLSKVGGVFNFGGNQVIDNIDCFKNLKTVGGMLFLTYNYMLSKCNIEVICEKINIAPSQVSINNNGPNCNNLNQVDSLCNLWNCGNISDISSETVTVVSASNCLCNLDYIKPRYHSDTNQNGIKPNDQILRADLAKLVYYAIYQSDAPSPASNFPVPYLDLQNNSDPYFKYAKALCYLQYGDDITPYDRDFINFRPYEPIELKFAAKVIVEAYNFMRDSSNNGPILNVNFGEDGYVFLRTLQSLSLLTNVQSTNANNYAIRKDIFVILKAILDACSGSCNNLCLNPNPSPVDYYVPANFTPANLSRSVTLAEGFFEDYTVASFTLPGFTLPLSFTHSYSSKFAQLPTKYQRIRPVGYGWSHEYNAYIVKEYGWNNGQGFVGDKWVVHWPEGNFDLYNVDDNQPLSFGVYDEFLFEDSTHIVIKKQNQVKFKFTKYSTNSFTETWLLTEVEDRNDNEILVNYQMTTLGGNPYRPRILNVVGDNGRTLNFYYKTPISQLIDSIKDVSGNRHITFDYDSEFNLIKYKDPNGNVTTYEYEDTSVPMSSKKDHLLYKIVRPEGNVIKNTYSNKLLTSTTSGTTNPITTTISTTTNYANANPIQSTIVDGTNTTILNTFDVKGYLKQTSSGNVNIAYNRQNVQDPSLVSSINYSNQSTLYNYDSQGRVTEITLPTGIKHKFTYNVFNDIETYTDPKGQVTKYFYDSKGNVDRISDNLSNVTDYSFTLKGQIRQVVSPENISISYIYDSMGNLTEMNSPLDIKTKFAYDAAGRIDSVINPQLHITKYTYDNINQMLYSTKKTNTYGDVITNYKYDKNNNMDTITNALGGQTILTYNDKDQLKTSQFGNDIKSYTYYEDGLLKTYTKPNGFTFTNTYDSLGRFKDDSYFMLEHDAYDNVTKAKKLDSGFEIDMSYDSLNRMTTAIYGNHHINYYYDKNNNLSKLKYPGNLEVNYYYDANNRLDFLTFRGNKIDYIYDKDGRLKNIINGNGSKKEFRYDATGRLVIMSDVLSSKDTICSYRFLLDSLGNHKQELKMEPLGDPPLASMQKLRVYNNENEESTSGFVYDSNGNRTNSPTQTNPAVWDQKDMLLSYEGRTYTYDALGLRNQVTKNGDTKKYIWDIRGIGNILAETDASGNILYYYIYGQGLEARINATDNSISYYHSDFRGSTIAITNQKQEMTHKYSYLPYGEIIMQQEADPQPFKYVGKYGLMSEGNDIYYVRARYLDAAAGRFLSEDPIWHDNLYPYAGNNPVANYDIDGKVVISSSLSFNAYGGLGGDASVSILYDTETGAIASRGSVGLGFGLGGGGNLGGNIAIRTGNVKEGWALVDKFSASCGGIGGSVTVNINGNLNGSFNVPTSIRNFNCSASVSFQVRYTDVLFNETDYQKGVSKPHDLIYDQVQLMKKKYSNLKYSYEDVSSFIKSNRPQLSKDKQMDLIMRFFDYVNYGR